MEIKEGESVKKESFPLLKEEMEEQKELSSSKRFNDSSSSKSYPNMNVIGVVIGFMPICRETWFRTVKSENMPDLYIQERKACVQRLQSEMRALQEQHQRELEDCVADTKRRRESKNTLTTSPSAQWNYTIIYCLIQTIKYVMSHKKE